MLTDNCPMPSGRFKGLPMAQVPAAYLLKILESGKCNTELRRYIQDNKNVLEKEVATPPDTREAPDPFDGRL